MVFTSCVCTLTAYVIEDTEFLSLLWLPYFHCDGSRIYVCRGFLHLLLLGSQISTSFSVIKKKEI